MIRRVNWLNSIRDWQQDFLGSLDAREFVDCVTDELFGKGVLVFTPFGEVMRLPKASRMCSVSHDCVTYELFSRSLLMLVCSQWQALTCSTWDSCWLTVLIVKSLAKAHWYLNLCQGLTSSHGLCKELELICDEGQNWFRH